MTDPTEAIRKAHAALMSAHKRGASVVERLELANAFRRSLNNASAFDFTSLFDRLDSAERDQRRYQWLRGNVGEISTSAFEDMQFYGEPGDTQDALRLDAAIDAAMRAGEQKEPK